MCGIAGIINKDTSRFVTDDLKIMMNRMKHRGPDDEGIYTDNNVGLGFVRLSIIDLTSAGHQPMYSNDKRYVIIYNGEVYNYIELKNKLKEKYNFISETDTEVVLAAFQEWGINCLEKFNGMFAFIIYDNVTKELYGARDRFGIKPLYYFSDSQSIYFASEIKSILPLINTNVNNNALYNYLVYNRTDITDETFFSGVKKLPKGSWFKLNNNEVEINKWYRLNDKCHSSRSITSRGVSRTL